VDWNSAGILSELKVQCQLCQNSGRISDISKMA
jgi:hypothetical protein